MGSDFVHLHCHSTWSLRDGAIPAETLPYLARAQGYEAIALTDHDALTGAVRFARACRQTGVKPIYGAELTTTTGHVTVIARDATGYANLCRLISDAHLSHERDHPETTIDKIVERSEGLFVLSGCEHGAIARLTAAGRMPQAIDLARRWRSHIGESFRIEVFDHRGYGDRLLRDRLLKVASEAGVAAVATNDVHYAEEEDAVTHELLHAIKEIVPLSRTTALRRTSEYSLKRPAEMRALFTDAPEVLDETVAIADACDFDLDFGTFHFPDIPVGAMGGHAGETHTGLLARRCYEGARRRYDRVTKEIDSRLQHELQLIFKMGFAAYFLLVADIVSHARHDLGIRCACRGSAAGSLVCYVLGISDVDPVRYDLLFERFINERREELPDIDVDVESHRREEVLAYILDTYGAEQTAMCCMVDTFRARMAIREVGKALGIPADEIDTVAKAFPRIAARDIPRAIERLPELAGTNLRAGQLEQLFELCVAIDGFPRHLALHPSGVILSSPDLADRVPMQESFQGFTMLQADKDDVEELGLAKLDVLGVRMLSSIAHAVGEVERSRGTKLDLDSLPHDDPETFALIRTSRTLGCFQIESPGQRELLARFQPDRFEDLIIDISLFRPGPVKSDMVSPFLERRHGFQESFYAHPDLKPILKETNGVVVYHEQVIRVIQAVTGCSLADADYVRRHLDADRPAAPDDPDSRPRVIFHGGTVPGPIEIVPPEEDVATWFIESAIANGFPIDQARALWKEVFSFASFGFCKAHAAAFALPTYLSSWLKAHYPAEFLAGVLTHDPGMYPRRLIVADARQMGIPILPIEVNSSDKTYRVEHLGETSDRTLGIRLALSEVRDISDAEIDSILTARTSPFMSLEDLWRRTELSRPVLENLIHIGALDLMADGRSRRELLWRGISLSAEPKPAPGKQLQLALDEPIQQSLDGLKNYSPLEETEAELEIGGIDARRHIMELYGSLVAEAGCIAAAELRDQRNRSHVWVAGVKVASQTPAIRSGQRIIFVTLDDITGPIDVTVFERVQAHCARTVFHSWLLLVKGEVRKRGGASRTHQLDANNVGITVVAEEVFDLAELASDRKRGIGLGDALARQRERQRTLGLADKERDLAAPMKLWHASGGSAGH
ncbi:MAG: DNA polymerase III subunit alpha [Actinomycetota bacterium]